MVLCESDVATDQHGYYHGQGNLHLVTGLRVATTMDRGQVCGPSLVTFSEQRTYEGGQDGPWLRGHGVSRVGGLSHHPVALAWHRIKPRVVCSYVDENKHCERNARYRFLYATSLSGDYTPLVLHVWVDQGTELLLR